MNSRSDSENLSVIPADPTAGVLLALAEMQLDGQALFDAEAMQMLEQSPAFVPERELAARVAELEILNRDLLARVARLEQSR